MATQATIESPEVPRRAPLLDQPRTKYVLGWAVVGVAITIIEIIAVYGWVANGEVTPTPVGPDKVPTYMHIAMRVWEALGMVALVAFLYYFLIRPWRRDRRLSTDGLLCFVFLGIYWQDMCLDYFQMWCTWNSGFLNWGSWYSHIPGWLSPNGNLIPEPVVWVGPIYVYCVLGGAMVGCVIMRKTKERWPDISQARLVGVCLLFFMLLDAVLEPIWMLLGFYTFPGAIKGLTFFHGHFFQFPVYENLFAALWWTGFACIRYFRNDKNQTLAERGIDQVRAGPKSKTFIRYLALVGACNLSFLVTYNLPMAIMGLYSDPWPEDITSRSYMMQGKVCGEGSEYACASPDVPIPRPNSAHVGPDGRLRPEVVKLP